MSFNAFTLQLTQFMVSNHPDRVDETSFIEQRGNEAARTFAECSRNGFNVEDSILMANRTLYRGLLFSPYRLVNEVVQNELDNTEYSEDDTALFTMQMLSLVRPVIDGTLQQETDPDAFEGTYRWCTLYAEITALIKKYLQDYGL